MAGLLIICANTPGLEEFMNTLGARSSQEARTMEPFPTPPWGWREDHALNFTQNLLQRCGKEKCGSAAGFVKEQTHLSYDGLLWGGGRKLWQGFYRARYLGKNVLSDPESLYSGTDQAETVASSAFSS